MALSNTYNLEVKQGDDFTVQFTIQTSVPEPLDLTGYTARLMVRKSYGTASVLITATTENGGLVIDTPATDGVIFWNVTSASTAAIRFVGDNETLDCVYDLEIVSSTGAVITPARGTITLYREVTRG